ncbi:hypothetical protein Pmani_006494 [Petrolisthes manimaculis]|uniref:Uncharacterized protein n=1 Tax=Petrolisthes manimaculis TaxID=1843537 RepID=A0AAE1UFL4_9EUCA|nr:hypothetical protein Pmani_006494 [Petrolisthes manimaculis]
MTFPSVSFRPLIRILQGLGLFVYSWPDVDPSTPWLPRLSLPLILWCIVTKLIVVIDQAEFGLQFFELYKNKGHSVGDLVYIAFTQTFEILAISATSLLPFLGRWLVRTFQILNDLYEDSSSTTTITTNTASRRLFLNDNSITNNTTRKTLFLDDNSIPNNTASRRLFLNDNSIPNNKQLLLSRVMRKIDWFKVFVFVLYPLMSIVGYIFILRDNENTSATMFFSATNDLIGMMTSFVNFLLFRFIFSLLGEYLVEETRDTYQAVVLMVAQVSSPRQKVTEETTTTTTAMKVLNRLEIIIKKIEEGRNATLNFYKWFITSYILASTFAMISCIFILYQRGMDPIPFVLIVYAIISICVFNFTAQMFTSYVQWLVGRLEGMEVCAMDGWYHLGNGTLVSVS